MEVSSCVFLIHFRKGFGLCIVSVSRVCEERWVESLRWCNVEVLAAFFVSVPVCVCESGNWRKGEDFWVLLRV